MNLSALNITDQFVSKVSSLWSSDTTEPAESFAEQVDQVTDSRDVSEAVEALEPVEQLSMSALFSGEQWSSAFSQLQDQLSGSFSGLASIGSVSLVDGLIGSGDTLGSSVVTDQADATVAEVAATVANDVTELTDDADQQTPDMLSEAVGRFTNNLFEDGSIGWGDAVDMVNPIQHVPIVSDAYSALSGDDQGYVTSILGSLLLGASPVTVAATAADIGVEVLSGHSVAGHAWQFAQDTYSNLFSD